MVLTEKKVESKDRKEKQGRADYLSHKKSPVRRILLRQRVRQINDEIKAKRRSRNLIFRLTLKLSTVMFEQAL